MSVSIALYVSNFLMPQMSSIELGENASITKLPIYKGKMLNGDERA